MDLSELTDNAVIVRGLLGIIDQVIDNYLFMTQNDVVVLRIVTP